MDASIEKVAVAAADRESAQFQLDNTSADLRDEVLAALSAGANKVELAGAAGLSMDEISEIINGSPETLDPED